MESKKSLYEILSGIEQLDQEIQACGGEITEKSQEMINEMDVLLTEKVDGVAEWLDYLESSVDEANKRIEQFKEISKSKEKQRSNFIKYIIFCSERSSISKFEGHLRRITVRQPSKKVEIINENLIPVQFFTRKEEIVLNKKSLSDALKNGESIEGARLIDGEKSIIIK